MKDKTEQFIDNYIQDILARPAMHAASLETMESMIYALLLVRINLVQAKANPHQILREMAKEWRIGNTSFAHAATKQYGQDIISPNHQRFQEVINVYKNWVKAVQTICDKSRITITIFENGNHSK